jgi:hypothetical protein
MQRYKKLLRMVRFVTTFLSEIFCRGICLPEVARTGVPGSLLSDYNIVKENDHPKQFNSLIFRLKSYSKVKYAEKTYICFAVFLSPYLLPLTSHRHISLLTGKSHGLSGQ